MFKTKTFIFLVLETKTLVISRTTSLLPSMINQPSCCVYDGLKSTQRVLLEDRRTEESNSNPQTSEDIVKLLSRPSSQIILVFRHQMPIPNCKVNALSGGVNIQGWENFVIFD